MTVTLDRREIEMSEIELENVQEWLIIEPTEISAIETDQLLAYH